MSDTKIEDVEDGSSPGGDSDCTNDVTPILFLGAFPVSSDNIHSSNIWIRCDVGGQVSSGPLHQNR